MYFHCAHSTFEVFVRHIIAYLVGQRFGSSFVHVFLLVRNQGYSKPKSVLRDIGLSEECLLHGEAGVSPHKFIFVLRSG